MSKILFSKVSILGALMTLALSGCSIGFNTGAGGSASGAADGGIFKSSNKGAGWEQKVLLQTTGARRGIGSLDIISLALDPEDNKAIYAGSAENGLFYSYDGGEGWQAAATLGKVSVTNVAVDPANKCLIYATANNKVYKSVDCNRTWAVVYFDNDPKATVTSLIIENSHSNNIYIGTSRGEIIKSSDRGGSWQTLNSFGGQVDKIVISPVNAKVIFVGSTSKGVFRSVDAGLKWINLSDKLKSFDGGRYFRDLIMVRAEKPTIFLASNYGLAKSTDGGESWSKIDLIIEKAQIKINSLAVDPYDTNGIYYVTNTTFFRSLDGGKNWTPRKLPTSRAGSKLLIDPKNTGLIYLAVKQTKAR